MDTILQLMMGTGLAASAGLRAAMPLFAVGLLARFNVVHLNPEFAFLGHDLSLIVCGILTVLEFLGDKVIAVDHFLDAIGTVARPIAGAILVASTQTHDKPETAALTGLLLGGGTSFTIHAGKAVARAKTTAFAPLHFGTGNAALSTLEDFLSLGGVALSVVAPFLAFTLTLFALIVSALLIFAFVKTGRKLFAYLRDRRAVEA